MKFYSQYKEDLLLDRIFRGHIGVCVEVGANDGVTYSNTKHFEELGWQCILVEPTPALCEKIKQARTGQLFECAASSHDGEMQFHIVEGQDLYSSLELQATMSDTTVMQNSCLRTISVRVRRLDDILDESGVKEIDFLSVDVEGHELSVLQGFNLEKWNPRILIVEDPEDFRVSPVKKFLKNKRYTHFYRSGGNDWYARSDVSIISTLTQMAATGALQARGVAKAWLPQYVTRLLLKAKRAL